MPDDKPIWNESKELNKYYIRFLTHNGGHRYNI